MSTKKSKAKNSQILEGAAIATAAGVAVGAAALALSNKKTRKKIGKEIKKLEKMGSEELDSIIDKVKVAKAKSEKKIKSTLENLAKEGK
jgi:hypothetical protein